MKKPTKPEYDSHMDAHCATICDALNRFPGVATFESCNGHFKEPFRVWFTCSDFASLAAISRIADCRYSSTRLGWRLSAQSIDSPPIPNSPLVCFELASEVPYLDDTDMECDIEAIAVSLDFDRRKELRPMFATGAFNPAMRRSKAYNAAYDAMVAKLKALHERQKRNLIRIEARLARKKASARPAKTVNHPSTKEKAS